MAFDIDAASDHLDLYDRLIAFVSDTGGAGWDVLDTTGTSAIFRAPGLDDAQQIYVGLSVHESPGTDAYAVGFWQFRDYNSSLDHLAQPGISSVWYLPVWNTAMPYWVVGNKQRLIVVPKVSTVYPSAHVGKLLPSGTPGEYPQPYYVAAPVPQPSIRWSTIVEDHRAFFDPGNSAQVSAPGAIWRRVQNFEETAGESPSSNTNSVWPYAGSVAGMQDPNAPKNRYRELITNLDDTYPLWNLEILGGDPSDEIYGVIDGCYACTGHNSGAENTVTIGGVAHLMIPNMHRAARYAYAALRLE